MKRRKILKLSSGGLVALPACSSQKGEKGSKVGKHQYKSKIKLLTFIHINSSKTILVKFLAYYYRNKKSLSKEVITLASMIK
ncbi:MAG: hypothetical protein ACPIG7_07515, partial [Akkermansiaceae bacterium]